MLYQRLLDLSLEGLLRVDSSDRIAYANARLAEMMGWGQGELEGRPVYDLLFPEDTGRARSGRRGGVGSGSNTRRGCGAKTAASAG